MSIYTATLRFLQHFVVIFQTNPLLSNVIEVGLRPGHSTYYAYSIRLSRCCWRPTVASSERRSQSNLQAVKAYTVQYVVVYCRQYWKSKTFIASFRAADSPAATAAVAYVGNPITTSFVQGRLYASVARTTDARNLNLHTTLTTARKYETWRQFVVKSTSRHYHTSCMWDVFRDVCRYYSLLSRRILRKYYALAILLRLYMRMFVAR